MRKNDYIGLEVRVRGGCGFCMVCGGGGATWCAGQGWRCNIVTVGASKQE